MSRAMWVRRRRILACCVLTLVLASACASRGPGKIRQDLSLLLTVTEGGQSWGTPLVLTVN